MAVYLLPAVAYLLGSVSSAIMIARLFGLKDPRQVGSGNPGATNILRYGGKWAAVITLLGDILKGVIPVVIARLLTDDAWILALVMLLAFLGHLYPVFHGFKGGKGVATAFGVLTALQPWIGVALIATWLAVAVVFRYSSLAAIVSALLTPFYVWWLLPGAPFLYAVLIMTALLLWRHRSNIEKLLAGKEGKIKF
jgi:acyl phosphate:glycerol-3-phosphate acyltransferase